MQIAKIFGVSVGVFAGLFLLLFFLFPKIQPERVEEIRGTGVDEELLVRGDRLPGGATTSGVFENLKSELDSLQHDNDRLMERLNSLKLANDSLITEMEKLQARKEELTATTPATTATSAASHVDQRVARAEDSGNIMNDEALSERVKSLLNLDEEELAGIVKHLDESQLLLLYRYSGNIQREKLLRSLAPDRAAKLMRTVML